MAGIKATDVQYILNTITIQGYQDALGLNHDFLDRLGGFKVGKARIQPKIHYGANTTAGSYGESDDISGAGRQQRRTLELPYKRVYVTVGVDGLQEAISTSGGMTDIPNLLTEEINDGIEDLLDEINTQLLGDGTGNSAKDISGVQFHIADDNTWAGLDRTTTAWIQSYINDNATNRNLQVALMRTVHETLTNTRKSNYNEIWTSSTMRKVYSDLMADLVRYISIKVGDVEMEKVTYEGRPIVDFAGYASNRFDFVQKGDWSVKYLPHKSINSKTGQSAMGPFKVKPVSEITDDATFNLIMYVQLVCKNPWKQGSLQDVQ